jgi:hypothetical protein
MNFVPNIVSMEKSISPHYQALHFVFARVLGAVLILKRPEVHVVILKVSQLLQKALIRINTLPSLFNKLN